MDRMVHAIVERGDKKVKIEQDGYGLSLLTTENGIQWSGFRADNELIVMMEDAIKQYLDAQMAAKP